MLPVNNDVQDCDNVIPTYQMPTVHKENMYPVATLSQQTTSKMYPKNFVMDWYPKNANLHLPVAIGSNAKMNFPFLAGPPPPTSILHHHHVMYTGIPRYW